MTYDAGRKKFIELVENPTNPMTSSQNVSAEKTNELKQALKPLNGVDEESDQLIQLHPVLSRQYESEKGNHN